MPDLLNGLTIVYFADDQPSNLGQSYNGVSDLTSNQSSSKSKTRILEQGMMATTIVALFVAAVCTVLRKKKKEFNPVQRTVTKTVTVEKVTQRRQMIEHLCYLIEVRCACKSPTRMTQCMFHTGPYKWPHGVR